MGAAREEAASHAPLLAGREGSGRLVAVGQWFQCGGDAWRGSGGGGGGYSSGYTGANTLADQYNAAKAAANKKKGITSGSKTLTAKSTATAQKNKLVRMTK